MKNEKIKIQNFNRIIMLANPVHTLERGFSITRDSTGKVLRHVKDVKANDVITTQLSDGTIETQPILKSKRKTAQRRASIIEEDLFQKIKGEEYHGRS